MTNLATTGRFGGRSTDRAGARDMAMDASKGMQILEKWYKRNPDDAREYGVEDIVSRFSSEGVTRSEAQEMYNRIRREQYGRDDADPYPDRIAMDPLTSKGEEIKSAMEKEYGPKKGESVFYASANKGTITGVHDGRFGGRASDRSGARDSK